MNKHHNLSKTRIYKIWQQMKYRCDSENATGFEYYGGKGIGYDKRWKKFIEFYKDMASTYKPGLFLDRIDGNKGYSKENCRWATAIDQANNRSNNRNITFMGKSQSLRRWALELGIKNTTLHMRIRAYGWSIERALTT